MLVGGGRKKSDLFWVFFCEFCVGYNKGEIVEMCNIIVSFPTYIFLGRKIIVLTNHLFCERLSKFLLFCFTF